ncbi:MAG: hypothetical protein AB1401_09810 [Thermodesulfobacteriota bacterium]
MTGVKNEHDIYAETAIGQIPRLLSMMDRKEFSLNYGCLDRPYWQYRMIDFPGASFQTAALSLAMAYKNNYPHSVYFNNRRVKKWAIAAIQFLAKIQNADGSFSHFYPNIWSLAVVAFPVYSVSEAYLLLEDEMDNRTKESLYSMFKKAGDWMVRCDDMEVTNQMAGAAMALYNIYLITQDNKYLVDSQAKIDRILTTQTPDGYFYEYGGGDIGYSTVTIDYLAKYYQKTGKEYLLEPLERLIEYVSYFFHPNFTSGGEYASRNNEFVIPGGFEILADRIPLAGTIGDFVLNGLKEKAIIDSATLDGLYLCVNNHSYLEAYENYKPRKKTEPIPHYQKGIRYFPFSKTLVINNDAFYSVVGAGKGGTIRIYTRNGSQSRLLLDDCGLVGRLSNSTVVSSQWLDPDYKIDYDENKRLISIKGNLHRINQASLTSCKLFLSRIVLSVISKLPSVRRFIYKKLRQILITKSSSFPVGFKRDIQFYDEKIIIVDHVIREKSLKFLYLDALSKFTTMYGQSKEFFQPQELFSLEGFPREDFTNLFNKRGNAALSRTIYPREEKIEWHIVS